MLDLFRFVNVEIGKNGNPGSFEKPWRTIQHGIDQAEPGMTINVRGGTYEEMANFNQARSGTKEKPCTLKTYQREPVTISSPWAALNAGDNKDPDWWVVDGFDLQTGSFPFVIQLNSWNSKGGFDNWILRNLKTNGPAIMVGSNCLFERVELDGTGHPHNTDGLKFVSQASELSHDNSVIDCDIHGFTVRGVHLIHRNHNSLIERNRIYDIGTGNNDGIGIDPDGHEYVQWNHRIRINEIYRCGEAAVTLENNFGTLVERNDIHDNGLVGVTSVLYPNGELGGDERQYGHEVTCQGLNSGNVIRKNHIYKGAGRGIAIYNAGGVIIDDNDIYENAMSAILFWEEQKYNQFCQMTHNRFSYNGPMAEVEFQENIDTLFVDDYNVFQLKKKAKAYAKLNSPTEDYSLEDYQALTGKGLHSREV